MAKYPASRTRGLIKMDVLSEGEENRPHRIRAATAVHEWFAAMTATERGELLRQMHHAHLLTVERTSALPYPTTLPASLAVQSPIDDEGLLINDLELLTKRVGLLRNLAGLSAAHRVVVEAIRGGAALHHDSALYELRWPDGRKKRIHGGTAAALLRMISSGT